MIGKVLKKHGGFYNVANDGKIYECKLSGKQKYKQKDYIVAGDFVEFDFDEGEKEAQGYITAIRPRENYIPRPGIANIDQILIVAAIKEPSYDFLLLDKLLNIAFYYKLKPTLCFSKMDLGTEEDRAVIEAYYKNTGIPILYLSYENTLTVLGNYLKDKTTVLTGNSGVGKSSMINRLLGKEVQTVQDISMKLNRGKNTTRTAEFFSYSNGFIVDTPGFSALDFTPEMTKYELKDLYPEYDEVANQCRFNNCVHINEPDCEVKLMLEQEAFSQERYENYKKLYQELVDRERMRK